MVVNNFRAGVMERMGFGYEELPQHQPAHHLRRRLRLRRRAARYAHKGGQDVLAQAMTGVMARKRRPSLPTVDLCHGARRLLGRHALVQGILLALLQREKTGVGQKVSVSLYNSMLAMQMQEAAMWLMRERELNWGAMPLTGVFETHRRRRRDRRRLQGQSAARHLRGARACPICRPIRASPTFAQQVENKAELHGMFRERFATNTTAHWLARLEEQDLLCAPVRTCARRWPIEQTAANDMVVEAAADGGRAALRRLADRHGGRAGHGCAARRRASASTPTRSWPSSATPAHRELRGQGDRVSVRFDVEDHVARVTIDRPDVHERDRRGVRGRAACASGATIEKRSRRARASC